MRAVVLLGIAGCRFPTFETDVPVVAQMAFDYTVDELRVVAVRAAPPLAPAGEPRTLEALVVGPGGTRHDAEVSFSVCGLSPVGPVGVTDLRCFENDELVDALGSGNPRSWDVPSITFPDCVPFDVVGDEQQIPGELCTTVVPLLAVATGGDEVAMGANNVSIPAMDVPETVVVQVDGEEPQENPPQWWPPIGSAADPTLPVTLTAAGEARPGSVVDLEVALEDTHYNRIAWWVTGGTLDQSGRTLVARLADGSGYGYNGLQIPEDARGSVTVWVVLTEWFDAWGAVPSATHVPHSQSGWAELTLEIVP